MRRLIVLLKSFFMATCAVVIFGVITSQPGKLDQFVPVRLPSWMTFAGIVLMAAGALLAFSCFGLFATSGALPAGPTFPDPGVFVSQGPYNYVRSPMSEGGLTVLIGWGVASMMLAIEACSTCLSVWLRVPHLRFHDLRHPFATRLVQAGVDIITVQH